MTSTQNKIRIIVYTNIVFVSIFIVLYNLLLKQYILRLFLSRESYDLEYYTQVFNNLEYSAIIWITISFVFLLLFNKVKEAFQKISVSQVLYISIALTVILQIISILSIRTIPFSDSEYYVKLSERLFHTGKYISESGHYTAFWPVGLPYYLSLLQNLSNNYLFWAKILNILISVLTIIVFYFFFKENLSQKEIKIFLLLWTFFPNNILSANVLLTEYPTILLVFSSLYFGIRKSGNKIINLLLAGFIASIAAYYRSTSVIIPLILLMFYVKREKVKVLVSNITIVTIVMILFIFPWTIRNYNVFGGFVPLSTNSGFNFLMGNHSNSKGNINFDFEYDVSNPQEIKESRKAFNKGLQDIIASPVVSIVRVPLKVMISYLRGDSSVTWAIKKTETLIPGIILSIIFFITNAYFFNIIIISILAFLRNRRRLLNSEFHRACIGMAGLFILLIIVFVGNERYILPFLPLHFVYFTKFFNETV